jgi:hypothetical protein
MPEETLRNENGRFLPLDQVDQRTYNRVRDAGKDSIEKEDEEDFAAPEEPTGRENMKEFRKIREAQTNPKSGAGVQRRIDRLIKERAELRERVARYESGEQTNGHSVDGKPSQPEPTEEERANAQKKHDRYYWRLEEARKKHEDFEELQKIGGEIKITPTMAGQIIDLDNGAEVAVYLARHPEIAKDLHRNPRAAQREIDYISRMLEEESRQDSLAEKIGKVVSRAPAPIKPVNGGSTRSTVPLDQMDMKAFKKAREAGRVR